MNEWMNEWMQERVGIQWKQRKIRRKSLPEPRLRKMIFEGGRSRFCFLLCSASVCLFFFNSFPYSRFFAIVLCCFVKKHFWFFSALMACILSRENDEDLLQGDLDIGSFDTQTPSLLFPNHHVAAFSSSSVPSLLHLCLNEIEQNIGKFDISAVSCLPPEVAQQIVDYFSGEANLSLPVLSKFQNQALRHLTLQRGGKSFVASLLAASFIDSLLWFSFSLCFLFLFQGSVDWFPLLINFPLESLTIWNSLGLSENSLTMLVQCNCPIIFSLTSLDLTGCRALTPKALTLIGSFVSLTNLDLSGCTRGLTNQALKAFSSLSHLQSLNLSHSPRLTSSGLVCLASFPQLQSLDLSGLFAPHRRWFHSSQLPLTAHRSPHP